MAKGIALGRKEGLALAAKAIAEAEKDAYGPQKRGELTYRHLSARHGKVFVMNAAQTADIARHL